MTGAEIHMLTGAYALDAVTGIERAHFERHLQECDVCAQEVDELREMAARLAVAVEARPAPALRAAVLARITATRQTRPVAHRRWRARAALALAAAAAVVGALAGGVVLGERPGDGGSVALEQSLVRRAPDAVMVSGPGTTGGHATVVASRSLAKVSVSLEGVPELDDRHAYQVWLIGPRGPQSAGLLRPGTGPASLAGVFPADIDRIGITTEPVTGSPQPTTPGVIRIDLS
ncbi:anti-sigma factor [Amycolatopsis jejuensis]|uniref:anti-sigma factor n=1 Tax=Amycolatopsis jejuensis TaxID=330084 RepID=UPI000525D96B|nr:anti-sigma factor [Amycolatopsis jejuensis]